MAIDHHFPSDQTKTSQAHAVFSAILRLGYFQAVGFLESLLPFDKMMTDAGLNGEQSWKKCLTYSCAVFARIYEVRTISADYTLGTMIHGMLAATQMLQAYGDLGWIRHPDVSSALVVASLQREGRSVQEALGISKGEKAQIQKNKLELARAVEEFASFKRKNPTLNT